MLLSLRHDRIDHRHEADMLRVLEAHDVERRLFGLADVRDVALVDDRNRSGRQQALRLQLFATEADDHHFAAEIGIEADVAQRADRDHRIGCIDRDAAAIRMLERDHVVDVRILRQQLGLDPLHREVGDAGHALHRLRDRQDVARADRAIGIAKALERVALERRLHRRFHGGDRQRVVELARGGHLEQPFMDPAAGPDVVDGVADRNVVAHHRLARGNVDQRHLVTLRHALDERQAGREYRSRGETAIVGDDRDVVGFVHADRVRFLFDGYLVHRGSCGC